MANKDCLQNEDEIVSLLDNRSQINSDLLTESNISTKFSNVLEVSLPYMGEETDEIIVNVNNTRRTISANLKKSWFNSLKEFPAIGSSNMIYCDIETKAIYIWNEQNAIYEKIIGHWSEIEEINGGGA